MEPTHAQPEHTLLIVDDEINLLHALKRLLHREGYRILVAPSGVVALELLALYPVQVIVCDQRMPGMNGTEFLGKVQALYPDTVRLVLSNYAERDKIADAIERGTLAHFYSKPWDNDELRGHIREAFKTYWRARGMTDALLLKPVPPE